MHITPPINGSSQINVGNTERIASVLGGALLAYYGLRKPNIAGLTMAAVGGIMLFRGTTGYCPVNEAIGRDTAHSKGLSFEITRSVTINRPRAEVYKFWRQLENLPQFMKHLETVKQLGPKRSHWTARIPGGVGTIEWDADIEKEVENELIAWRSLPAADINNAGEVRFSDSPDEKETVVQATISYSPPAGSVGGLAAKLLNPMFKNIVVEDMRRLKRLLETSQPPARPEQEKVSV